MPSCVHWPPESNPIISVSQTGSIWLIIVAAFIAANLPFLNHRLMAVGPMVKSKKSLMVRLMELVALYFLVGGMALLLERRAGQIAPQGWEFYAVTGTLFLTLAFPGFVYRYLLHRHG
jgi:predicted transporter